MRLRKSSHGGQCCGIRHLSNFTHGTVSLDELTPEKILEYFGFDTRWGLCEVVLTNRQLSGWPGLGEAIQKAGFQYVHKFNNPNSGNICNVFHWIKNPAKSGRLSRLPFKIIEKEVG